MPEAQTDSPPGLRFPLVSLADLPAAVPVARSAAPASPTSVQTASAAAWRAAASDARSRFRATAVAHVAPAPRLSTLPPEEDSDPEASWLPCAEYRMNLRRRSAPRRKSCAKEPRALHRQLRIPRPLRPPPVNEERSGVSLVAERKLALLVRDRNAEQLSQGSAGKRASWGI